MQSIDVTDSNDVLLKRDFFAVLPQAIPQFPRVTNAYKLIGLSNRSLIHIDPRLFKTKTGKGK